ncbi:endoplasmic reticulum resident protein 44-like isoform X2 [Gigantopelta aegis]|uniref:endoplasmic reticulum resident protein 44-like isoform X2 n=1 Tax=Gigantopelta aegis TaxID=1735272 RepID=UPI001B887823|nr:endoplasmic reticulum resident protein 44-like isoform X2 [Gigantopelta aegis]
MKAFLRKTSVYVCYVVAVWLFGLLEVSRSETVAITDANAKDILSTHEIVFVNFYADWCRFSQMLTPVFEEASNKVREEFPMPGRVAFGKVDCDNQVNTAQTYRISKYPTLKLFRNGEVVKKEYRGQRSAEALASFIRDQLKESVVEHQKLESLDELEGKKRHVIGYFQAKNSDAYRTFAKVASSFRDDCQFHAAFGPVSESERSAGDTVVFRPPNTHRQDIVFTGTLTALDQLNQWVQDKCVPLVREITFENAEELTEEGLPFLILFHKSDDQAIVDLFNLQVQKELIQEKNTINFLTADGSKFTHPLHHLGKSLDDLPVLAIDSFRHMYIFPHSVKTDMVKPGLLKQFIEDLHSGKLHREFHHGPDPITTPTPALEEGQAKDHIPKDASDSIAKEKPKHQTSPPESTFRKLAPSGNRYTILRDEL